MEKVSTNESCDIMRWIPGANDIILEIILEGLTLSTAVILNIFLLVTISSSHLLRTSTHIFICSLAVSDILASVYGYIRLIFVIMAQSICFSHATRKIIDIGLHIAFAFNTFSGYMNICIVSGERWLFISRPYLHQRLISRRFTFVGVTVAWASSLLLNLDGFIFSLHNYSTVLHFNYLILFPCIHTVVTAVLCFIYVHLTIITRRQMAAINKTHRLGLRNNDDTRNVEHTDTRNVQQTDTKMKLLRENLRSIRLLVTVFGGFVVLLSPGIYYHFYFYVQFSWDKQEHPHIHEGFKLLTYSHSCVNFVVFASLDRCFRKVLMTWLRKATCRHVRCVSEAQNPISVCRRCRSGYKVGVNEGRSRADIPTL